MMIKRGGLLLLTILLSMPIIAQEQPLTLQDLIPGGKTAYRFTPRDIKQLQWYGDTYLYAKGDSLYQGIPEQGEKIALTLSRLNETLETAGLPTLSSLPNFTVPYNATPFLAFGNRQHLIHYDLSKQMVLRDYQPETSWENASLAPEGGYYAFTNDNNVVLLSPEKKILPITNETDKGIVSGQAVHQREFGITKGLFWSPTGKALAFYRMDERMVTDYPIVDIDTRCAAVKPFKYPMAGMKSHEVTVGVYHLETRETVWLQTGLPKEKYLTNIAWSPDGKHIYIAELNREQNHCRMVRYNAETGAREKVLFEEQNDRYVEPQHPVVFLPEDSTRFIWQSQRDGFNHLYLYDTKGKLLKQLTSGEWVVTDFLGFDRDGTHLYVAATAPLPSSSVRSGDPMQIYAWRINIGNGERFCLNTKHPAVHSATISPSGKYALDRASSPSIPRDIDLIRAKDGKIIKNLLSAPNPYAKYTMPEIVTGTILSADGRTPLNYRLVKPVQFDETKKYPAIVYVYGGPHAQLVTGDWMNGVRGWDLYMAQRGYVVFTVDGRGSANRGFEFESVIHRNLGVKEMEDQLKGVEFLKSLPFVDSNRLGVHGWSYGGFMTTNLMLTYPDLFKAGVAGGPVIDWSKYEIMYGERYMDHPKENPEGYRQADLTLKADRLKGHLLLIHGTADPVVVWQHSLSFLKACIEKETYPDYFVYPGHQHNVTGRDRVHLHEKITRYFDDYLK